MKAFKRLLTGLVFLVFALQATAVGQSSGEAVKQPAVPPLTFPDGKGRPHWLVEQDRDGVTVAYFDAQEQVEVRIDRRRQTFYIWASNPVFHLSKASELFHSIADYRQNGDPQDSPYINATMLQQQSKVFDDGLILALDKMRHDAPASRLVGQAFLDKLIRALAAENEDELAAFVAAAAELGGMDLSPFGAPNGAPFGTAKEKRSAWVARCEKDMPLSLLPVGAYTWKPEYERIFRQDRLLQTKLETDEAMTLKRILEEDADLLAGYRRQRQMDVLLSNPSYYASVLEAPVENLPWTKGFRFFSPSGEMVDFWLAVLKLDPPPGERLNTMIRLVREGTLSLKPRDDSGWYDWRLWAIEPLIDPDRAPEFARIRIGDDYRDLLEAYFKAYAAQNREVIVKVGSSRSIVGGIDRRKIYNYEFVPTIEPLAEYYRRQALGYRFIREALAKLIDRETLADVRREYPLGEGNFGIVEELTEMERLFNGAYLLACYETGLAPQTVPEPSAALARLQRWRAELPRNREMAVDLRAMVPVRLNRDGTYDVWLILGAEPVWLWQNWLDLPVVTLWRDGQDVTNEYSVNKRVAGNQITMVPVTIEGRVKKLLNRQELQAALDQGQELGVMLQAIGQFHLPSAYAKATYQRLP